MKRGKEGELMSLVSIWTCISVFDRYLMCMLFICIASWVMKLIGKWGEGFRELEMEENGVFARKVRSWAFLGSTFELP